MKIQEAIVLRIEEIRIAKHLSVYALAYSAGMPESTLKSILNGKSRNAGIVTLKKIMDGLEVTPKEFYESEIFDQLEQEVE